MRRKELFDRASRAWLVRCRKESWIPDQPGESASEVDLETGIITLQSCNGVLAVYRYCAESDRMRYVEVEDIVDKNGPQVHRERSTT